MRFLIMLAFLPSIVWANVTKPSDMDYVFLDALLSKSQPSIKIAALAHYEKGFKVTLVSDAIAELLAQTRDGELFLESDTASWLVKSLGVTNSMRYYELVDSSIKKSDDRKFIKYAKQSIDKLSIPHDEKFTKGLVDFTEVSSEIKKRKLASNSLRNAAKFEKVSIGDSLESIVKHLGMPDALGSVQVAGSRIPFAGVRRRVTLMTFNYKGLGELHFSRQGSLYQVAQIMPDIEALMAAGSTSLESVLSVSDPRAFQKQAKLLSKNLDANNEKVMDGLAEFIWMHKDTEDKYVADGLAYLCKVFMRSPSTRYNTFLTQLIEQADNGKVSGYAEKALDELPEESNVAQFTLATKDASATTL